MIGRVPEARGGQAAFFCPQLSSLYSLVEFSCRPVRMLVNKICRSYPSVMRAGQGKNGEEQVWMPTGNMGGITTKKLELVKWEF